MEFVRELDVYTTIAALSGVVVLSYVFSLISKRTRIPTVLMLLLLGIGIRETLRAFDISASLPLAVIQFFGVLGLILVLLEAGLDLRISKHALPIIKKATASSLFVLILSVTGIASIVHFLLDQSWLTSLVYAVPISVISSTIVASSIGYLSQAKREFLTYESSLSDIFGILLFNFLIAGQSLSLGLVAFDIVGIIIALVMSVVVSIGLVYLLAKVDTNIKAFLIFPVLFLIYAFGHKWQLPTLLTVLVFGFIINNWRHRKFRPLHHQLKPSDVEQATQTVKSVTTEAAFLIRTIFFTLFGYMIDVRVLGDTQVLLVGTLIVGALFLIRYLYLRIFISEHVLPELFFAPRGLVTIVLYYSIPAGLMIGQLDDGVLFFVILVTTLIMTAGSLWLTPKDATRDSDNHKRSTWYNWIHHGGQERGKQL